MVSTMKQIRCISLFTGCYCLGILAFTGCLAIPFWVWICGVWPYFNMAFALCAAAVAFLVARAAVRKPGCFAPDGAAWLDKAKARMIYRRAVICYGLLLGLCGLVLLAGVATNVGGVQRGDWNALSVETAFYASALGWLFCAVWGFAASPWLCALFPAVMVSMRSCGFFLSEGALSGLPVALAPVLLVLACTAGTGFFKRFAKSKA